MMDRKASSRFHTCRRLFSWVLFCLLNLVCLYGILLVVQKIIFSATMKASQPMNL